MEVECLPSTGVDSMLLYQPETSMAPRMLYERIESNIGEGTYGKIHKARDTNSGRIVAIKKAKTSTMDRDIGGISFTVLREIKLMQAVRHPNVMGYLDIFSDGGAIHIVMEFMDGDLRKLIDDKTIILAEPQVKCLASQILGGLSALHAQFFVHRDLCPANILLSFTTGVAKLGDFGFARTLGSRDQPLTGMCTTLWYRAPELLYGAKFYWQMVDIWSLGCIIGEMFCRHPLFPGRGEFDMLTKIFEKTGSATEAVWSGVSALPTYIEFSHIEKVPLSQVLPTASEVAREFIGTLLTLDPKLRPTADTALSASLFQTMPLACAPRELPFVRHSS